MSDEAQTEQNSDARKHVTSTSRTDVAEEKHELLDKSATHKQGKQSYTNPSQSKRKHVCPNYFGVKSYLHEFYDPQTAYKDPQIYEEDDDYRYLLNPDSKRRRRCAPIWLKCCIWLGVNLLILGMVGIIIGYFVPQKPVITKQNGNVAYIDHSAVSYNTALDLCKLVGLICFCVGGILLALALLFPSFLSSHCEDDYTDDAIKVHLGDGDRAPLTPLEMAIPATSKLKNVQPEKAVGIKGRPPPQDDIVNIKD